MIDKFLKFLLALAMLVLPLMLKAADNCDSLYHAGIQFRQTITVEAQNRAIQLFLQAEGCYDQQYQKDKCRNQVNLCVRTINRLGGEPDTVAHFTPAVAQPEQPAANPAQPASNPAETIAAPTEAPTDSVAAGPASQGKNDNPDTPERTAPAETATAPQTQVVAPGPSNNIIEENFNFKRKGNEPLVHKIDGNDGYILKSCPSWLHVEIDNIHGTITVTADDNDGKERTATIILYGSSNQMHIHVKQKGKPFKF